MNPEGEYNFTPEEDYQNTQVPQEVFTEEHRDIPWLQIGIFISSVVLIILFLAIVIIYTKTSRNTEVAEEVTQEEEEDSPFYKVSVNDSYLIPPDRPVPDNENGYLLLESFHESYLEVEELLDYNDIYKYLTGENNWNTKEVEKILEISEDLLEQYITIHKFKHFRDPQFFYPKTYNPHDDIESLNGIRTLSGVSLLKAEYEIRRGNKERALDYLIAPIKLSHMMYEPNAVLIQLLVSVGLKKMTYDYIETLLDKNKLSNDSKSFLAKELNEIDNTDLSSFADTFRIEYLYMKNGLLFEIQHYVENGEPYPDSFLFSEGIIPYIETIRVKGEEHCQFNVSETVQMFADFYKHVVESIENGCPYNGSKEAEAMVDKYHQIAQEAFYEEYDENLCNEKTENIVGVSMFSGFAASLGSAVQRQCALDERQNEIIDVLK